MDAKEIEERVLAVKVTERFNWNLRQMEKSHQKWIECLKDIHDKQLYRNEYASFEDFCFLRLGISRDAGYKKLEAHGIKLALQDKLSNDPIALQVVEQMSEVSLREAGKIELEKRAEVIRELSMTGKVTAERVKRARTVESLMQPTEKPVKAKVVTCCPRCGREL